MLDRKKKLFLNTASSIILQAVALICGFILPRLILESFGSEVNGLVNSISQFLGIITLLDMGVGAVVQSALYKPLADNDITQISGIYVSAQKFFKRLAMILLIYVAVLVLVYPFLINKSFGFAYTAFLIIAISISSFAQYYFGIVNSLLLNADQKGYIQYIGQIITLIINTIACYILIKIGASIQIVKLTTSLIFLLRPLYLMFYVKKHYDIDVQVIYNEEPIKQKWNGMAQHFASFVLSGTDSIVLTVFADLSDVSIYNIYNIVVIGVKNAIFSMTNGFQALLGNMLVKKEYDELKKFFGFVEWTLHTGVTLIFGCTGMLIVDFIKVYTKGISDADYIQPLFAVLITLANAGHCLRLPYNLLILAAGHYKQTQNNYIIAMILNIGISIITVFKFGLIGVSIGTLVAMMYQTFWMAWYNSKNIINWPYRNFLKQMLVNCITVCIASLATYKIQMLSISYSSWFICAIKVFLIWLIIVCVVNYIFYKEILISFISNVKKRIFRI